MEPNMNYPMRSIAFIAELIHPPLKHQAADLQQLHGVVFADPECQYNNFQMMPVGAQMSNPPGPVQSVSCCTFLNDRIQIREEMTGMGREDFETRLRKLSALSMSHLKIPAFMVLQFVVRALINTKQFKDSREFVSSALFNMEKDNFLPLDRNTDILGIRLALSRPDQKEGLFNLRVESYSQDPRSLFIETIGTFRTLVKDANLEEVEKKFAATYSYIESNVVPFLAQFDETP